MPVAATVKSEQQTVDDTIAAVAVAGRLIRELRGRLLAAEGAVTRLEQEKEALCAALQAATPQAQDALASFIRGIDASFGRSGAVGAGNACH